MKNCDAKLKKKSELFPFIMKNVYFCSMKKCRNVLFLIHFSPHSYFFPIFFDDNEF